VNAKVRAQFQ